MYLYEGVFQWLVLSLQPASEDFFYFVIVFLALPIFQYSSSLAYLYTAAFVLQNT